MNFKFHFSSNNTKGLGLPNCDYVAQKRTNTNKDLGFKKIYNKIYENL